MTRAADVAEPQGRWAGWLRFWFTPAPATGLHRVRLLAGLALLAWLLPLAGHHQELFGLDGWFDVQAFKDASHLPEGPPLAGNWSLLYFCGTDPTAVSLVYWGSVLAVALFTLGVAVRLTAVAAWVVAVSFTANPAISHDADLVLVLLTFNLMVGYLLLDLTAGDWRTRILGPRDAWLLGLRLLQTHLAIFVVFRGLSKLQYGDWWSGVAFWYPLHPPFQETLQQIVQRHGKDAATYLTFLSLGAYAVMAWQIAFPLFAWRPRWRLLLIGGAAVACVGSVALFDVPVVGPTLLAGSFAYLTPDEWRRLGRLAGKGADPFEPARDVSRAKVA